MREFIMLLFQFYKYRKECKLELLRAKKELFPSSHSGEGNRDLLWGIWILLMYIFVLKMYELFYV